MGGAISIDLAAGSPPLPEMARIRWTQLHRIPYDIEASLYGTVRRGYEWRVSVEYYQANQANPDCLWDLDIPVRA